MEYAARKGLILEAAPGGDREDKRQICLPEGGEARKFKGKQTRSG